MLFSTRTRYGLRFLLCLAELPPGELIQLSQVGERENISSGYLQQIARALRPLDILKTVRGAGGGYGLSKPAETINLEDVINHLEGNISPVHCLTENCPRKNMCSTLSFWQEFDDNIRTFLRSKTLRDLERCSLPGGAWKPQDCRISGSGTSRTRTRPASRSHAAPGHEGGKNDTSQAR